MASYPGKKIGKGIGLASGNSPADDEFINSIKFRLKEANAYHDLAPCSNLLNYFKCSIHPLALPRFNSGLPIFQGSSLLGPLRYLAISAPTVGHALVALIRYVRRYEIQVGFRLEYRPGQAVIFFENPMAGIEITPEAVEIWVAEFLSLISELRNMPLQPQLLSLSHSPLGEAAAYENYFNCPVLFCQDRNYLSMPAAVLEEANIKHSPDLHAMVRYYLEVKATPSGNLKAEVERQIIILLPQQRCTLEQVALAINLHPRTLQRRLAQVNVDFEECVDEIRRRQAEQMLRRTSLTAGQISYELGYRRITSFCRAHLRWFDMTPLEHRQHYADPPLRAG